ncbi:hypothetical protein [Anaerospora hongkongensis]|uniref:hypothetical protein n=1 Tax=Anaerospora hongkongensis TaxID=244830 RepID=UPI0028A022BC|nr:hypothetical protein [Anaerospora hongkongensis]
MDTVKNIIKFEKSRQTDNHYQHTLKRGDGNMTRKEVNIPIVKITLLNYDPSKQDTYSKNFMSPLIKGILTRVKSTQAN